MNTTIKWWENDLISNIEIIKITNEEFVENQITYGNEEAKAMGIEILSEKIEKSIKDPENILQKYENTYAENDYIDVEVVYEVLENVGTKEKIVFWKEIY